jgi:hypothetical protein
MKNVNGDTKKKKPVWMTMSGTEEVQILLIT